MKTASKHRTGAVRRWTFRVWIALTIIAAAYFMIAAPLVTATGAQAWIVAAFVPGVMIALLGLGVAWLVWQATRPRAAPPHAQR